VSVLKYQQIGKEVFKTYFNYFFKAQNDEKRNCLSDKSMDFDIVICIPGTGAKFEVN
jgi:hypothetical protein